MGTKNCNSEVHHLSVLLWYTEIALAPVLVQRDVVE